MQLSLQEHPPRRLSLPASPCADCNYDGSSAASGGAPTPACFCRGLVGFFPNTRNGCSRAWACTGLEGIGGVEFGCPAGQAFSAQRERCVPTANALCGPPSAFFGGGFIGAWPDAQPPPTLDNVPVSRPFYYILSFAREGAVRDGVFAPVWDTWGPQLTPQVGRGPAGGSTTQQWQCLCSSVMGLCGLKDCRCARCAAPNLLGVTTPSLCPHATENPCRQARRP